MLLFFISNTYRDLFIKIVNLFSIFVGYLQHKFHLKVYKSTFNSNIIKKTS